MIATDLDDEPSYLRVTTMVPIIQDIELEEQRQKQIEQSKIINRNINKRLSRDEKMTLLIKTIKRRLIIKQKQHFMFVMKFLRQLSDTNPQLRSFK